MSSFDSIVCGVDPSPQSTEALRRAARLARESGARLTLIHVEPPPRGEALFAPPMARAPVTEPPSEESWCQLASELRGEQVELHYAMGEPGARIVEFAREHRADLIVLGSAARSAPALALGSCITRVIAHAPCPVLIVPPEPRR